MPSDYCVFLRGINANGINIKMSDLAEVFKSAVCNDFCSYLAAAGSTRSNPSRAKQRHPIINIATIFFAAPGFAPLSTFAITPVSRLYLPLAAARPVRIPTGQNKDTPFINIAIIFFAAPGFAPLSAFAITPVSRLYLPLAAARPVRIPTGQNKDTPFINIAIIFFAAPGFAPLSAFAITPVSRLYLPLAAARPVRIPTGQNKDTPHVGCLCFGVPGGIRTPVLSVRSRTLYPA